MDTVQERPRWRTTLDYRVTPKLQIGLEYNAAIGELDTRGNWFLQTEDDTRPGLIAGWSSDRIGTPYGKMYFLTATKLAIANEQGFGFAPYMSLAYSEFDKGFTVPFGASIALGPQWTVLPMYDGHRSHTTLSWSSRNGRDSVTLIAVFNKRFGLSYGRNF